MKLINYLHKRGRFSCVSSFSFYLVGCVSFGFELLLVSNVSAGNAVTISGEDRSVKAGRRNILWRIMNLTGISYSAVSYVECELEPLQGNSLITFVAQHMNSAGEAAVFSLEVGWATSRRFKDIKRIWIFEIQLNVDSKSTQYYVPSGFYLILEYECELEHPTNQFFIVLHFIWSLGFPCCRGFVYLVESAG